MGRKLTRGGKVIRFIETYCLVPEGTRQGKPFKLLDFQKKFIREIYDNPHGTRHAYLSIARRNGKTGLIACLLIVHLIGPEAIKNSQITSGANSREQASLVFNMARKIIEANPELSEKIRIIPSRKMLLGKYRGINTEYQALAAEGSSNLGRSPVLAILDEVGEVKGPTNEFIDAIVTAQGSHENPLLIAISTQAADDQDMFSTWLDDAENYDDKQTVSHVYSGPPDCDLTDIDAIKAANPASGNFRSIDDALAMGEKAKRMPANANTYRRYILNQRVNATEPFISRDLWKQNGDDPWPLDPDLPIYCGLDLSSKKDLTAFSAVQFKGGKWNVHVMAWTPEQGLRERSKTDRVPYETWIDRGLLKTTPGRTVGFEYVIADIATEFKHVEFTQIAYDRWRIDQLRTEMERAGISFPMIEVGQGYRDISPCIESLEEAFLNNNIRHGNNPLLTMAAFNVAITTSPSGDRKFDKKKTTGRIDPMQALVMAFHRGDGDIKTTKKKKSNIDLDSWIANPVIA